MKKSKLEAFATFFGKVFIFIEYCIGVFFSLAWLEVYILRKFNMTTGSFKKNLALVLTLITADEKEKLENEDDDD